MQNPQCAVLNLGLLEYARAWALQQTLTELVRGGELSHVLLLLEHPHVYTLGRRGRRAHILLKDEELARLGIEVHEVDRGGEVTYHGPGQLVAYPILNLRGWGGPVRYVRCLEEALLHTLAEFSVRGNTVRGQPGVWVSDRKIAFIGVRITGGITGHGIALNVNPDLNFFDHIVPCGMPHLRITSMAEVLRTPPSVDKVGQAFARQLGRVIGVDMADSSAVERLMERTSGPLIRA